ncbi:oligosaccharide flippase family protein [Alteraurantiacibacter aestuarii]|uniref:Oligosaccharide flippase family protein n=1 Tax=Alteraurantiacibacter aestuarii TaxID=650004 RepID=A0A844ZLH6_9SPHN|nr:flippase [Alteraurantiacibacter aestuarii]MXO88433.1 oligosaccharide flippase family protein [Alteraurantiacibacter aestuarii]
MKIATNSLLSFLPACLAIVIGIATVPIYINMIGNDRYGALMIAWLLLGYFGQADFGIGRAIAQRIGAMAKDDRSGMARAVWSALFSVAAFGFVGAALIYAMSSLFFSELFKVDEVLRAELLDSLWLLALCVPLIAIAGVVSGALTGLERFKLVSLGNTFSNAASQILPLVVAWQFSHELKYLIGSALVGRLLGLAMVSFGVWKTFLKGESIAPSKDEFRRLAGFGAWIMVTAFVGPLMTISDRFVIGAVMGAAAVVAYSVPFQIALRTMIFPYGIIQALFPRMAAQEHGESIELSRTSLVFIGQLYAPIIIGLICLAGPLMKLWLGDNLDLRSILIGQIVLVGFWVNALANVPYTFLQARGNPRFTAILHVCELPAYFLLLYFLGTSFGLAGAAIAFALRCALDCIVLLYKARLLTAPMLRKLAAPGGLVAIALALCAETQDWFPNLFIGVVLGSLAVLVTLLQMPDAIRQSIAASKFARYMPPFARKGDATPDGAG